ncbi:MAG: hypothetical protein QOF68_2049 [Gaiellales bacterium]|nr:hypothetical protein [Gaiellales bacterium]
MPTSRSDARQDTVLPLEFPGDLATAMADRSCTACGRTQTELERVGETLRFLCPDDVCTGCLGDSAAA